MSVTGFNRRRRELEKRKQQERSQAVALDELTFHELRALAKDEAREAKAKKVEDTTKAEEKAKAENGENGDAE